jgi:hypothetical protein
MPVFPSVYTVNTSFSQVSSFHVEQPAAAPVIETLTFSQWLVEEITSVNITPVETTPNVIEPEPVVEIVHLVRPVTEIIPPPTPLLPTPVNLQPARGHRITMADLQTRRNLSFYWQQVPGAHAYILTIYRQAEGARTEIHRSQPQTRTNYLLENLRVLDRGTFFWRVEAVTLRADGTIDRRGNLAESSFVMDIVLPGAVQVEGASVLYE